MTKLNANSPKDPIFSKDFEDFLDLSTGPSFGWNVINFHGETPLSWVIKRDKWSLFEKILAFRIQEQINVRTYSAIRACITSKHGAPYLKSLLGNGVEIEFKSAGAPLLINAVNSGTPKIVELLLQEGANLEAVDGIGDTALIYAASGGEVCNIENLKVLLKHKPNIAYLNKEGFDATAISCQEWPLTLSYLLNAGADPLRRYKHGKTLLMLFQWKDGEPEENFESLGYPVAIDMLLEKGLSLDDMDEQGKTVMSYYTNSNPLSRYMIQKQRERLDRSLPISNAKGKIRL